MIIVVMCDLHFIVYCAGHSIVSERHYSPMTEDLDVHNPVCKRRTLNGDGCINKEVSDDHILKIYPQLENWKRVAFHLGLTQADIQAIESAARADEQLMRLNMLQEWKRNKMLDEKATYQVLLKALIDCKCSESVRQVHELLEEDGPAHTNGIA